MNENNANSVDYYQRLLDEQDELNKLLAALEHHIETTTTLIDQEEDTIFQTHRQRTGFSLNADWLLKNGQRFSDHLREIIAAIQKKVAGVTNNDNPDANTTSVEQFNAWLKSCPRAPVNIKFAKSPVMNPLIGPNIYETAANIRGIVEALKDAVDSGSDEGFNFRLEGTFGLVEIFKCMIGALEFEDGYREDALQNNTPSQSHPPKNNNQEGNHHE